MNLPNDLVEYLRTLISPPAEYGAALYISDLEFFDFASCPDSSMPGIIACGTPTEKQAAEIMRVLRPGAHLLLAAPDEQPTGHTGAIRVEDAGMEIRDAILLVEEPGRFHYVAKAARKEREAGCHKLKGKRGHDAVERKEGTAGLNNPRAGAGRTAEHVKNFHPTVKPIDAMVKLLHDVPRDQGPVLDPFMGSGTTGIACLRTRHDFVGIERETEYLEIADARVRYWDRAKHAWLGTEIVSEHKPVEVKPAPAEDFFDFFG